MFTNADTATTREQVNTTGWVSEIIPLDDHPKPDLHKGISVRALRLNRRRLVRGPIPPANHSVTSLAHFDLRLLRTWRTRGPPKKKNGSR